MEEPIMAIKHQTKTTVRGIPKTKSVRKFKSNINQVLKIAGCMQKSDADEMKKIIEEGCEQIDNNA